MLKCLERLFRKILCSGDQNVRKMMTISWLKICSPFKDDGLGIRSLVALNDASRLKLCWNLIISKHHLANMLRHITCIKCTTINYYISSSLWCGLKSKFESIMNNFGWVVGKGNKVNFQTHNKVPTDDNIKLRGYTLVSVCKRLEPLM